MDIYQIQPGSRVRVRRGSEVKSTISGEPQTSKRAQVVTVHSVDPGWCDYMGYITLDGRMDIDVDSRLRQARHLPPAVVDALELLGAAASVTEVMELVDECSCIRTAVWSHSTLEVLVDLRPATVRWSGAGSYWRWTAASNVEIVS